MITFFVHQTVEDSTINLFYWKAYFGNNRLAFESNGSADYRQTINHIKSITKNFRAGTAHIVLTLAADQKRARFKLPRYFGKNYRGGEGPGR